MTILAVICLETAHPKTLTGRRRSRRLLPRMPCGQGFVPSRRDTSAHEPAILQIRYMERNPFMFHPCSFVAVGCKYGLIEDSKACPTKQTCPDPAEARSNHTSRCPRCRVQGRYPPEVPFKGDLILLNRRYRCFSVTCSRWRRILDARGVGDAGCLVLCFGRLLSCQGFAARLLGFNLGFGFRMGVCSMHACSGYLLGDQMQQGLGGWA